MKKHKFFATEREYTLNKKYTFYDSPYGYQFIKNGKTDKTHSPTLIERVKLKNFTPKQLAAVWFDKTEGAAAERWEILAELTECDGEYYKWYYNDDKEVAKIFDHEIKGYSFFDKEKLKQVFKDIDDEIATPKEMKKRI